MNAKTNIIKNPAGMMKAISGLLRTSPKITLAFTVAIAATLVIALIFWARSPDFRVVYSNISDEDGGAIVAQLGQMNVPYRFEQHGGAIMVPEDRVHEVRLKLAQLGLPKGGAVGFELLDQEKFGISQFSEQINFQRALEGELSRTIESLGPVNSARVHLAQPKPSMFVQEQTPPSAAVTVNLSQGRTLDAGQISAISHLVSSAVPGLNADQVTIVDQRGELLTVSGAQGQQSFQLKYTKDIEADYQKRIQTILAPLMGSQNVRAQVTAQFDFTSYEQTNEQFQPNTAPDKMAIRSRQSSQAEQGGKNATGGVPGALSNQPPAPVTTPIHTPESPKTETRTAGKDKPANTATVIPPVPFNNRKDDTTNYELDRMLTHTRRDSPRIDRLSAAVVVNYFPATEGESGQLTTEQLAQITALVKEAIGFSAERGDSVNIVNSPFTPADEEMMPPFWQRPAFISLLMSAGRYLLIALVVWLLWCKAIKPAWLRNQEMALKRLEMEKEARQAEEDEIQKKADRKHEAKAAQRAESEITTLELREMAGQNPRIIALVIRQWINKDLKSS